MQGDPEVGYNTVNIYAKLGGKFPHYILTLHTLLLCETRVNKVGTADAANS
jgi:hypothetical protein